MIYYTGDIHGVLTKIANAKNNDILADGDTLVCGGAYSADNFRF